MSTATLLMLATRLRQIAQADGNRRPAPTASLGERSRATRSAPGHNPIRRSNAGKAPRPQLPGTRYRPLACADTRFPFPRIRTLITASLAFILAPLLPTQSAAARQEGERKTDNAPMLILTPAVVEADRQAEPKPARRIGGAPGASPCVIVDIAGHKAGHLDCATDRLQAAADTAQSQARAGIDAPVVGAGSPDIQTGVAHQGATRLRMGDALGRSVHSERPPSRPPRGSRP